MTLFHKVIFLLFLRRKDKIKKNAKLFISVLIIWKPNSIRREVQLELGEETTGQMET